MSVKLLGLVYEGFPKGGSEFDVLLALADNTNENSGRCDPSVSHIAWKIRQSERTVQYALRQLTADEWIKQRKGEGKHGTNVYVLNRRKLGAAAQVRGKEYEEKFKKNTKKSGSTWDEDFGVEVPPEDGVQSLQVKKLHPCKKEGEGVQIALGGVQTEVVRGADGCTRTREPEVNQKEPSAETVFALPEWIPKDLWEDFVKNRKIMKKPLSEKAKSLAVRRLDKFKNEGYDITAILEETILRSWQSFFVHENTPKAPKPKRDVHVMTQRELDEENYRAWGTPPPEQWAPVGVPQGWLPCRN